MERSEDLEAIWEEYETLFLEPKIVSGWLGLPGSQLPRETTKIIEQPSQPARKKGSSARYSFEDAIRMKLGRTLMDLGVTPHRVRACVEKVREDFHTLITGMWEAEVEHGYDEHEITLYLVGRETSGGFKAQLVSEEWLTDFLTEKGLAHVEWRKSITAATVKRLQARDAAGTRRKVSLTPTKPRSRWEVSLDQLAEEGRDLIDGTDPGFPGIVQNVTRFVQDQSIDLYRYIKKMAGQKRT